jgi:hypothetical protein
MSQLNIKKKKNFSMPAHMKKLMRSNSRALKTSLPE